jgi:hypothetical protein
MLIDRYDKNDKQMQLGDYLKYKDGSIFKVIYNNSFLAIGIVDKDENFFFMDEWVKEDWEVSSYEELFGGDF